MVSRSFAETKSIMPPSANSISGKTSVAAGSRGLPPVGLAADGDRGLGDERTAALDRPLGDQQQRDDAQHDRACPAGTAPARRSRARTSAVNARRPLCRRIRTTDDQRGDQRDQRQHELDRRGGCAAARTPRPARRRRPRRTGSASAPAPRSPGAAARSSRRRPPVHDGSLAASCCGRSAPGRSGADLAQRGRDRGVDHVEHRLRVEAEDQQQRDQRRDHQRPRAATRSLRIAVDRAPAPG